MQLRVSPMTTTGPAGERTVSEQLRDVAECTRFICAPHVRQLDALSFDVELLEEENRRLKAALGQIASCESHHPDDVVSVARRALSGEGEDGR